MSKLLVIFGITGQQGSSVANTVLQDAELSKQYRIRGLTRDPTKPTAQSLQQKGIEVIKGDIDDPSSITTALKDANTVFAMTTSIYAPGGKEQEYAQGKAIADAAVSAGVDFLVYSTVPSATKISGAKYPVSSFDVKHDVKSYIETLPIKSAFFSPGGFMQNYLGAMGPRPGPDGTLAVTSFVAPQTEWPLIDIAADSGKFVGAMLADPNRFAGKEVAAATRLYSMTEIVETMSKVAGKEVKYQQVPKDVFAGFLPENVREPMVNMYSYIEEFGYFGAESKQEVAWAAENARGRLTTLEECLRKNGFGK